MDIEGAEFEALQGARQLLAALTPPVWLIEVHDERNAQRVSELLVEYSYTLTWLVPPVPRPGRFPIHLFADQPVATKPPFAELLRAGMAEKKVLAELESLKQTNNWQAVQTGLSQQPLDVSRKSPFAALQQWAGVKAAEDEALKAKSPAWLDAELEILLVRFNIVSANDRWLQTAAARQEQRMDGILSLEGKEIYLQRVNWLRAEYTKRNWLTQRDRNKYLDRLERDIRSR
jgi:hypothetical protein